MYQSIPTLGIPKLSVVAGFAAIQALAYNGTAVSPEAQAVRRQAWKLVQIFEQSQALFGAKAEALCQLNALVSEEKNVDAVSVVITEKFIRALPDNLALPEFGVDPDGSISLDWIVSRDRIFSLSVGANSRLAYAWLDGTDRGHAVARFDGQTIPERVLEGIASIA